jgi:hypothetical protein
MGKADLARNDRLRDRGRADNSKAFAEKVGSEVSEAITEPGAVATGSRSQEQA